LRVAGIGIYVHVTFLLLPLWVAWVSFAERHLWRDAIMGAAFVLVLFGIVLLHELGHALTARRFGIGTRDITLLPIGGLARLERIPEKPRQELLVALAGPAVNICLALLLFAIVGGGSQLAEFGNVEMFGTGLLVTLMWVNIVLAVFNLVPAFPMDGGRVLRALLAMRLNYVRATRIAAGIGQAIALVFAFAGLSSILFGHLGPISNPFLVLVGVFVWIGASREAGHVQVKSVLSSVPVRSVMITQFKTLSPQDPLSAAAELILAGWQHDFPVVEQGQLVGLLTRDALVDGLAHRSAASPVGVVMLRQFTTIDPEASAETALAKLGAGEGSILLAARDSQLVGIVSRQNVGEYLRINAALRKAA